MLRIIFFILIINLVGCGGSGGSSNEVPQTSNTAPVFNAIASVSVEENSTHVQTISASDAQNDTVTYSIDGTDVGFFSIMLNSGVLAFVSPPDYDNPQDADNNNVYQLTVTASDGSLASSRAISVTVTKPGEQSGSRPVVTAAASYPVMVEEDVVYAHGLSHNRVSASTFEIPLKLDIYSPSNNITNRPVYMFIHGGGFNGGTKTKPEIVNMANYYAARGWVFASIDYRTIQDLGTLHTGIAPQEWINNAQQSVSSEDALRGIAMYAAQRDAKAALRWIVANADTYNINTDYITVGGASAGAITTIALGISNQEDFRDEISVTDDPTLSTTNLNETYVVRSMVDLWGGNVKLEGFESVYGLNRYDNNDPELFIVHGTEDPTVLYSEATELKNIYDALGIYNELVPLVNKGHGVWNATVDGKSLSDMSFDFLVERQNLNVE